MVASIKTRELLTVAAGGVSLRGTHHKVQPELLARPEEMNRTGVLFLNSGFSPRAAGGDASVYWADAFAKCGYPSFRFDLPGLGDSDGELPGKVLEFAHLVNTGHYASFVSRAAKYLTDRFNLSGVVLVGHCAGAVSAIYGAAAASKQVKGLVHLDAYFIREEEVAGANIRREIILWAMRNKLAAQLTGLYGRLSKVGARVKKNELPKNANLPLIRCWNHLAAAGVPMLVLNSRAPTSREGEFDYLSYLQAQSRAGRIAVKFIERANHSFADDLGRAAVQQHTEQWLNACFPLVERDQLAFSAPLTVNHPR